MHDCNSCKNHLSILIFDTFILITSVVLIKTPIWLDCILSKVLYFCIDGKEDGVCKHKDKQVSYLDDFVASETTASKLTDISVKAADFTQHL